MGGGALFFQTGSSLDFRQPCQKMFCPTPPSEMVQRYPCNLQDSREFKVFRLFVKVILFVCLYLYFVIFFNFICLLTIILFIIYICRFDFRGGGGQLSSRRSHRQVVCPMVQLKFNFLFVWGEGGGCPRPPDSMTMYTRLFLWWFT